MLDDLDGHDKNNKEKPKRDPDPTPSGDEINQSSTIDEWYEDATNFIKEGEKKSTIDKSKLGNVSNTLYNILLAAGIITAVFVGMVLGIKYMVSSLEEKADLKQALMGYVVGCIVIFGAFGIWKLVIQILSVI